MLLLGTPLAPDDGTPHHADGSVRLPASIRDAMIARVIASAGVRVELWDGSSPPSSPRAPIGSLIVRDFRTL
jgi:hypothetical protein